MAARKLIWYIALAALAAGGAAAATRGYSAETTKTGSYVHVPAGETVKNGLMVAGAAVVVDGDVQGDVLAFGAYVVVNGSVSGNVLACGATVSVTGDVAGNVQAYGATVNVTGAVGGRLETNAAALFLRGAVQGETAAGGAAIWLGGAFARGVTAEADYLAVEDGAALAADLNYRAGKFKRAPGAAISGKVTVLPPPEKEAEAKKAEGKRFRAGWWAVKNVWAILALFVVAALLSWLCPTLLPAAAANIKTKPWVALGVGAAVFAGAPLAVLILAVTVIGIPSAFILAAAYVAALYTARVFAGVFVGREITAALFKGRETPALFAALVGIIVLVLGGNIPYFKFVLALAADVFAFGALALYVWRRRKVGG